MMFNRHLLAFSVWLLSLFAGVTLGADTGSVPPFKELYEVLRTNLTGVSEKDLDKAAAQGLLRAFQSQVSVQTNDSAASGTTLTNLPAAISTTFDGVYGYIRLGNLIADSPAQLKQQWQNLVSSNRLKGLVLDLRFTAGQDFALAAALADLFFTSETPLLDWGNGMVKSSPKDNAIHGPLAVLVNGRTRGAAEALAGILRHHELGLVIGARTAGQASVKREVLLSTGQRLVVAAKPIQLAAGEPFPTTGLTPDILVQTGMEEELAWLGDAYRVVPRGERLVATTLPGTNEVASTNRNSRRRINEAELVRMQREGTLPDSDSLRVGSTRTTEKPTVQDPALARALDFLKGLSVVQQFKAPKGQ